VANFREHIQSAVDPVLVRRGRPLLSVSPLEWPRLRRLRGVAVPRVTRQVPVVEILAGAAVGLIVGLVWASCV